MGETPFIAPLWSSFNISGAGGYIGFRATSDEGMLRRAVEFLTERNAELSSFRPELLCIVTWNDVAFSLSPAMVSGGGEEGRRGERREGKGVARAYLLCCCIQRTSPTFGA